SAAEGSPQYGERMPLETSVGSPVLWVGFIALILTLLAFDLGLARRRTAEISLRTAALWTVFWVSLGGMFCGWVWWEFGHTKAVEFATGYVVEEALSVDNVFVFSVILTFFGVP